MNRKKVTIPRIEALQARANIYCLIKNAQGLLMAKKTILADTLKMSLPSFERHIKWLIDAGFLRQVRHHAQDIKAPSVYRSGVYPQDMFIQFLYMDCNANLSLEVDEISRIRITIEAIDRENRAWSYDEEAWFYDASLAILHQELDESSLEFITESVSSKDAILRAEARYEFIDIDGIEHGCTIYDWESCQASSLFRGQPFETFKLPSI